MKGIMRYHVRCKFEKKATNGMDGLCEKKDE